MPLDQRFYVGPIDAGQQTDVRPYLIPDQAFQQLNNAYAFRGRIRKRIGGEFLNTIVDSPYQQLNSRLRVNIGDTPGPLNLPGFDPALAIGQAFSVGNDIFTVYQLGAGVLTLSTNPAATATIDSTASPNTVRFVGEPGGTPFYWYQALPVFGFGLFETFAIDDERSFAFDTQFAYQFTAGAWQRLGTAVWTGSDSQFFWSTNYHGDTNDVNWLFVSNNNYPDGIKYWDDTAGIWTTIRPIIDGSGNTLLTARILLPFKNRLIALNTTESITGTPTIFPNRCRFSQNGSPVEALPTVTLAWNESVPGRGGYEDAPTTEQIITAQL